LGACPNRGPTAARNRTHGSRSLVRPTVETDLNRTRKETRADTLGRKIGPSYPGGLSGHTLSATSPSRHARSTIEHFFLTHALVTHSITILLGDEGMVQGEQGGRSYVNAGFTIQHLRHYQRGQLSASLPKRLIEVFVNVNRHVIWLDKAAICGRSSSHPVRARGLGRLKHET
jgi:hypothetical protein